MACGLGGVARRRARPVGVDVADLGRVELRVGQGLLHAARGALSALGAGALMW